MQHTTLEQFRAELTNGGNYLTPAERRAPVRRKPSWWTTLRFTWGPFSVFPKCAIWEALYLLNTDRWAHFCFESVRVAEAFGISVELDGWENRAKTSGPVVYVANHMSTLETILLPPVLLTYGPFGVVVKSSLAHLPCLERAADHMGLIPIGRKSPREDLMTIFNVGCERLNAGKSILIFPQGSRERTFARKGYSSIGAKLAEKAGVPLMPIAVKTDCEPTRPNGKGWFKDFGTVDPAKDVKLRCGPALVGKAKDVHSASFDWIKAQLDGWGLPTQD